MKIEPSKIKELIEKYGDIHDIPKSKRLKRFTEDNGLNYKQWTAFVNGGQDAGDQKINAHLKEIAKICGIKKVVTFHVARHSFATNFLRLGGTIEKLQELLGHSSITETRIYVHIVQEELDREIMIMDNLVVKPNSLNEL